MEERALTVLSAMLKKRGHTFDKPEAIGNALDETRMYDFGGILVVFSEKSSISEAKLQTYIAFATDNNYTNGMIVVTLAPPSPAVLSMVSSHIETPTNPLLQIFDIRHLQFDITTHRKVPAHRLLNDTEKTLLEKKFPGDQKRIHPLITCQDPMAKWIGARPGDVVEIIRFSATAGATPYYRYCVADSTRAR
jgi:DNA-directed RNA polymerase subunit H (RpoH/RPB5)